MTTAGVTRNHVWTAVAGWVMVKLLLVVTMQLWSPHGVWHHLTQFDAKWYVGVVEHGYVFKDLSHLSNLAFFPLFPGLAWPLTLLGFPAAVALEIVAVAGSLAAVVGITHVVGRIARPSTAVLTAFLWGVVPRSHVQIMPYTEGVFTACVAWCLYGVLTRRWVLAAIMAACASLTRATGLALVAAIGVVALWGLVQRWRGKSRVLPWWGPVAVAASGLAAFGAYWCYVAYRVGGVTGYLWVQRRWGTSMGNVRLIVDQFVVHAFHSPPYWRYGVVIAGGLVVYGLLVVVLVWQRRNLWLVAWGVMVWVWTAASAGFFHSKLRFLVPAFVMMIPVADWIGHTPVWVRGMLVALITALWMWVSCDVMLYGRVSP